MNLNPYGEIIKHEWICTPNVRPNIALDEYVIMPNHFHGIIIINAGNMCRGMACHAPTGRQFARPIAHSLSTIIGAFKSAVTRKINKIRNTIGTPVWQRNYCEHIIRNKRELSHIKEYIQNNPLQWDNDENNPVNFSKISGFSGQAGE
jgi:REP element-mobilizing transposase RayT